jgi:hypothetical protein
MKVLSAVAICCLIYQVSAGGVSFSSEQPVTAPSPRPLCPDCENFYKNGGPLSVDSCDPGSMKLCSAEAIVVSGGFAAGLCAGTATNPYPASDQSPLLAEAEIFCN